MLDILILYSLHKQELTFYGLGKYIAQYFGEISIPSHGAVHPALKRLMDKKLISIRKKLSDGGKRYSYYAVTDNFLQGFNELFMKFNFSASETLDAFLLNLKARLFTISLLDKSLLEEFKQKALLKLEGYENNINKKLENEYLALDNVQKEVSKWYIEEISRYKSLIQTL